MIGHTLAAILPRDRSADRRAFDPRRRRPRLSATTPRPTCGSRSLSRATSVASTTPSSANCAGARPSNPSSAMPRPSTAWAATSSKAPRRRRQRRPRHRRLQLPQAPRLAGDDLARLQRRHPRRDRAVRDHQTRLTPPAVPTVRARSSRRRSPAPWETSAGQSALDGTIAVRHAFRSRSKLSTPSWRPCSLATSASRTRSTSAAND